MATTKLKIYNNCLGVYVGTTRLANLTEDVPQRYAMDAVYDEALQYMLELGLWKFALRTVLLTKEVTDPTLTRQYAFARPGDYVRMAKFSPDDRLDSELIDYQEQNGKWYTDVNPVYLKYVSNGASYGLNLNLYPANYIEALCAWMAFKSTLEISKDRGDRADMLTLHRQFLAKSKMLDAVDEAVKRKPAGRWTRSRGYSINGTARGLY